MTQLTVTLDLLGKLLLNYWGRIGTMPQASFILPLRSGTLDSFDALHALVAEAARLFSEEFEILLVVNPTPDPALEALSNRIPRLRVLQPESAIAGKGAALRRGMAAARGELIYLLDADLPYGLDFVERAAREIAIGRRLVTANRRHRASCMQVSDDCIEYAARRHRLGVLFNRALRLLFPNIRTGDTQAGFKAVHATLARSILKTAREDRFLLDVEIFLTAARTGASWAEIPVTLKITDARSSVRCLHEVLPTFFGLLRLWFRELWLPASLPPGAVPPPALAALASAFALPLGRTRP
jgi:dolichyl-phosphate beta-glucosyltransferase